MRNRNRFDKDIEHEQRMDRAFKEISQMAKDYVPPTDKDKYYIKMDKKQTLQEIFNEIGNLTDVDYGANDKGGKIHTYLETYDRLFAPFRNGLMINDRQGRATEILEIGLALGDSIKLWNKYFFGCEIWGVDISIVFDTSTIEPENDNDIYILEGDATKSDILHKLPNTFDIIIDDADHQTSSQITTFNLLKSKMNKGGLYIIEDLLALDVEKDKYMALHDNVEIIDMRSNGRFDNCLCIIRF